MSCLLGSVKKEAAALQVSASPAQPGENKAVVLSFLSGLQGTGRALLGLGCLSQRPALTGHPCSLGSDLREKEPQEALWPPPFSPELH